MKFPIMFLFVLVLFADPCRGAVFQAPGQGLDLLGAGLHRPSWRVTEPCVYGEWAWQKNEQISFQVHQSATVQDYLDQKSGGAGVGVNFFLIGGRAATDFLIRRTEHQKQVSLIFEVDYHYGSVWLKDPKLNPSGLKALSLTPEGQEDGCGTHYVDEARVGAKFMLAASLSFHSEEAYKRFKTKISVSFLFGLIKITKEFVKEFRDLAAEATLIVDAIQVGGQNIIPQHLLQPQYCKPDGIERCGQAFQELYQLIFGKDYLREALAGDLFLLRPESFMMRPYQDLNQGFVMGQGTRPPEHWNNGLENLLAESMERSRMISHLESTQFFTTDPEMKQMIQLKIEELSAENRAAHARIQQCRRAPYDGCAI